MQLATLIKPHLANPAPALADQATMSAREATQRVIFLAQEEFAFLRQLVQRAGNTAHGNLLNYGVQTFSLPG